MLARRLSFVLAATCALSTLALGSAGSALPNPAPSIVPTRQPVSPTGAPETPADAPTPLSSLAPAEPPSPAGSAPARPAAGTPVPEPAASVAPGATTGTGRTATQNALNALANSLQRAPAPVPYASFVQGATRQPGAIALIQKDDDLYFELPPDALQKTYLIAPTLSSAIAADDLAYTGREYEPLIVRFERVGRRVLWIEPNTNYTAPEGSPEAASLAASVTDSVINATPIVAEDDATKRIVVPAAFFLSDVENVGKDLAGRAPAGLLIFGGAPRAGYAIDPSKSFFERVKALPDNDEITASLAFSGSGGDQPAVADARNVRVRMHYSILEAPALGAYRPRFADDRVGYFAETVKRLGENLPYPPFARYIDRHDPHAGPFVYYLSNEIPKKYRDTVRSAVLAWNDAFARIGMPHQMEVRDAPADASFDPDDIRYSTIRWVTGDNASRVAFGAPIADPRTGQILRAEVVIDGSTIEAFDRNYGLVTLPLKAGALGRAALGLAAPDASAGAACGTARCVDDDTEGVSSAALGMLALDARGARAPERAAFVRGFLRWVVMHEVGHTLGLSHNFAASGLYSLKQLHDAAFTAHHPLAASVMDYTPVNLSPRGEPQGAYFQDQIGPYDRWAIRYGYENLPFSSPESERPSLRSLADESTRPEYRFEGDQDANGPAAIDPRVNLYDLSNDPLAYARNQFTIDDQLLASLDRSPGEEGTYADERVAFVTQIRDYARAAGFVAKYVGGAYVSRDHRGQAGGRPPIRPVPRAESARAFAMLDKYLFSSTALRLSPDLLQHLGYDRFGGWGGALARPDYPAVELLAELQDSVLIDVLLAPQTASRLAEAEYRRHAPGESMTLHDLFMWTRGGVFDDLGPGVHATGVVHRGLQRRYVRYLSELALAPGALVETVGYPGDMAALSRQALAGIADDLTHSLRVASLDDVTRAHRADLVVRIRQVLNPTAATQP